jgi:hypothetical protein
MIGNMVGPSNGVFKEDVLSIKEALMAAKLYKPDPKIGLHEWTDEDMFEGIKQLQRFIGDYPDATMRPGDDAYHLLHQAAAKGGLVHVKEYTRWSNGQHVRVSAHTRQVVGEGKDQTVKGHVAKDLEAFEKKLPIDHAGRNGHCVSLVRELIPDIGQTSTWQEGEKIRGPYDPPLEKGTAIATFFDGGYPSNDTGNHAAIFIRYGTKDGKQGMWVLDQYKGKKPGRSFVPFKSPHKRHTSQAENYSVIKKGK